MSGLLGEKDPREVRSSSGPLNARYLSLRNHTLSLNTSTSSIWCVETSIAVSALRDRMSFLTNSLVQESHPLLGSSSRRTFGDPANARARASLLFMPPGDASGSMRGVKREAGS